MKVNIPVRFKNPWFWVGVGSVALTAIGVEPSVFTSWSAVWEQICAVLSNSLPTGREYIDSGFKGGLNAKESRAFKAARNG